jgi:DNA mismatch repair protein MSH6
MADCLLSSNPAKQQEFYDETTGISSFGICTLDASTGEFNLSAFEDDVVRTRLQTTFRQIRPKELVHAKVSLIDVLLPPS